MYESNIYIKNYATIKKYPGDIGVQLDMFDNAHGLKHNALARAQYKHWRSVQTGVPDLLSVEDKRLLGLYNKKNRLKRRFIDRVRQRML